MASATVARLFFKYRPHLVGFLENTGGFWPRVADNSITNDELVRIIRLDCGLRQEDTYVYQASLEMAILRFTGELPSPS